MNITTKKSAIYIFGIILLVSCKNSRNQIINIDTATKNFFLTFSSNFTFRIPNLDTTIKTTRISISDLVKNYKLYQGKYIETTGRFHESFEQFAIYADKNNLIGGVQGFWLGINARLRIDNASFDKMNGELVTIKGRIDTTDQGHMNTYLGTIDGIFYWNGKFNY